MQYKLKKVKPCLSYYKLRRIHLPRPDVLNTYLKHSEVNEYLDYLQARYPNFVKLHTLGESYEKRPLKAIEIDWCASRNTVALEKDQVMQMRCTKSAPSGRIKKTADRVKPKPSASASNSERNTVFIEGGTHAREWMTISVALHCIYQLTERNVRNRDVLRQLRFYIVPLVNPDGYEYSRLKNRKWRKNRRPNVHSQNIGTDCNRNYDFHWDAGSSKTSRNTFKGERPFSEPETCALRNIMHKLAPNILFFLSLHSYATSIMYPWGYSRDLPEHWINLEMIASIGRNAIKEYNGRKYRIGSIANLSKHCISGSIVDYAFGILKVPFALVMELPSVKIGFQPNVEEIAPIGFESWCGIKQMCKTAIDMAKNICVEQQTKSKVEKRVQTAATQTKNLDSIFSINSYW